jgi:hypothetical protein
MHLPLRYEMISLFKNQEKKGEVHEAAH